MKKPEQSWVDLTASKYITKDGREPNETEQEGLSRAELAWRDKAKTVHRALRAAGAVLAISAFEQIGNAIAADSEASQRPKRKW